MAFVRKSERKTRVFSSSEDLSTPESVLELAKKNNLETNPVNISQIAELLRISVRYEPMGDEESGSLRKDKKTGVWVMTVNSLHHPNRQRFTIAHEIAHSILHAANSDLFEDKTFFRNSESNRMEFEANVFAAELLMPRVAFENYIENVSPRVEDIASHFQVSSHAVRIRAKTLGYSGHNL